MLYHYPHCIHFPGPPAEAAGVHVRTKAINTPDPADGTVDDKDNHDTTRWIVWSDGDDHGGAITNYYVEFRTTFDEKWRFHPDAINIPVYETIHESLIGKHWVRLTNLKAGVGIKFRIRARNNFGIGAPSLPTSLTQINGAKPSQLVTGIRGGGGSVGDLTIVWNVSCHFLFNNKVFFVSNSTKGKPHD